MYETKDDLAPRRSSFSCAVPLVIIDSFSRRSFSYNKLPQKPLKLTVLKLDNSSFEIEVPKTATVAELRNSVENAFSHLPKQGPGKVSWSHVWGHFCLCFDGQKLLDDNDYIGDYEIRDGDQLLFARHLSINYNLKRNISTEQIGDIEQPSISNTWEPEDVTNDGIYESCDGETPRKDGEEDKFSVITACEYKLATILRGWFSYRSVSSSPEPNFKQKSFSRSSSGLLGSLKTVLMGYSNKQNPQKEFSKPE
ncbi:U11/U12 small nuclear ribonucleoprotein 25 kDa [Heracleum sosnowskyi]|uniref:U11/U12 small nuclear ribonucleoprotein 25 kDa n=1 Tax=Heracleum sosnowskyi TaxID=360622 RepID=A0AAD8J2M1_9APIA|nr:U11/U12 small nuclear ribonucleoprotein 25 kDa [Heracleum sosnowskyi]